MNHSNNKLNNEQFEIEEENRTSEMEIFYLKFLDKLSESGKNEKIFLSEDEKITEDLTEKFIKAIKEKNFSMEQTNRLIIKFLRETSKCNDINRKNAFENERTKIPNLRYFQKTFETECARLTREENVIFHLILLDLDNLKKLNDIAYELGNEALQKIAELLKTKFRKTDVIAHYGGDEFGIILKNISQENALLVIERLRKFIEKEFVKREENTINLSISLGLTTITNESYFKIRKQLEIPDEKFPKVGDKEIKKILDMANQALLVAKRGGKNQIVICDESVEGESYKKIIYTPDGKINFYKEII